MENKNEKVKLNDDLLDKISGGNDNANLGPQCQSCGNVEELAGFTLQGCFGNLYIYECNQCHDLVYYQW